MLACFLIIEKNNDCANLQKFVATNFKVFQNAYAIRSRKNVKRCLDTDRFGMM